MIKIEIIEYSTTSNHRVNGKSNTNILVFTEKELKQLSIGM